MPDDHVPSMEEVVIRYDLPPFSQWLAAQIKREGWTQAEFSRKVGSSPSRVSEWLAGIRRPSTESVDRIADILGVDVDLVLTIARHRPNVEEVEPDSVVDRLCAKVRRVNWTDDRLGIFEKSLDSMIDFDRKRRANNG